MAITVGSISRMAATLVLSLLALSHLALVSAEIQQYEVLNANSIDKLVGTWSTGTGRVVTGIDFFDPASRTFKPPVATGMAYSFSADGFWEQALYRAIPNPRNPRCVQNQLAWQHGRYTMHSNGTLVLDPFRREGCQLITGSCAGSNRTEETYEVTEVYTTVDSWVTQLGFISQQALRLTDAWGNRHPNLYKRFDPPMMLPTEKLYVEVLGL